MPGDVVLEGFCFLITLVLALHEGTLNRAQYKH